MPQKGFLSFRGEDEFKVWTLRNLAEFKNVPFDMDYGGPLCQDTILAQDRK